MCIRAADDLFFDKTTSDREILRVVYQRLPEANRRRFESRTGLMRIGVVAQHERVLIGGVFEVIKDSFFFHQARHEVESRFIVLNAILARVITAFQVVAKVSEAEL